ncbi:MAG TPA: class I SAM-dependent methyltransferase [Chitinophagaceae bacterium]|jgi:SAM-dependent methyltransferase|nr:class I SAM-dependent methyltransferase [Chitinophagaceae bacterium]
MTQDVLGTALLDYYRGIRSEKLWIHNTYGRKEEMPVSTYFREPEDWPVLEQDAAGYCYGSVLDIGAGAGTHALYLQEKGNSVTALDLSPGCVQVMRSRGVREAVQGDIFQYSGRRYDTLLLLMNGIGLCGSLDGLRTFLAHARGLLQTGGQLLFDSSDVAYLYQQRAKPANRYYGEIEYRYAYRDLRTEPFTWLYIDRHTLQKEAAAAGWDMSLLGVDRYGQYLVRLTPAPGETGEENG